ncbi:hypothetical protein BSZ35_11700 [Salinibacter sp. 10B]|uniref:carbohydrate binding family 9 domain-containing protein n=1 Tax=Salinibacter sp. 10B TaxID=1923971 RepID=UPI000CF4F563|nr:carbohydrate binding family 9 domain-containing protein [Salinibacter sp. 10B]PQJ35170.1 hypothetical protein BSZ35_11700 [Salinibacter sp. 10B]
MRSRLIPVVALALLTLGAAPLPLAAQPTSSESLRAHAVEGAAPIQLDGHLDEEVWDQAPKSTAFTQQEPVEGGPPSERTAIRVLYGETALYLGVTLFYSDPDAIRAYQLRRDASLGSDDRLMWTLDPYNDGRNAYFFETNPLGLRGDGLLSSGQGSSLNKSWDGIWTVETRRHEDGWTAEIRIPFRTLQFDPTQTTWGFNVQRTLRVENEEILWAGHERDEGIFRPQHMGTLRNVGAESSGVGLDVTPFGLAKGSRSWTDSGRSTDGTADVGGDLSYAFTPSLRTALTVNTDFAEVEVDQRRVNLTRFPLRFPEKRDFFLEGSSVFDFAPRSAQYPFFSRRIGLVDGSPVPILAGARMNGRMGRYNVGLFQVRTRSTDNVVSDTTSWPREDFTVARAVRNVGSESQVGVLYTRRATEAEGERFARLDNRHTLGADMELSTSSLFGNQNFQFQAFFVWHNAPLKSDTSSWGHRTTRGLRLNYPNQPWFGHMSYREFGNAYDPAVGFVRRRSFRRLQPTIGYNPVFETNAVVREIQFVADFEYLTDLALEPQTVNFTLTPLELFFTTGDRVEVEVERNFERLNESFDILRDGSILLPTGTYPTWGMETEAETAAYRTVSGEAEFGYGGFWSGTRTRLSLGTTVRPLPGLNASVNWAHRRVNLAEGDFRTHLLRFEGNVDLTPNLAITSQLQYDNLSDRLGLFARLRWILEPGSDLYLVYTHNWRSIDGHLSPRSAETAAKLTYTIRL